jgi:arylsulfatase A-like enzyme
MDWAPTLWDIAGVKPAADFPPDGISLAPVLTGKSSPIPRKLFWRYKFNDQRAMRYGDMKWLKIGKNDFLFNVMEDPLERANLKQRQPEEYKKLVSEYEAWEATMLPIDPKSASAGFTADQLADHFGVTGK